LVPRRRQPLHISSIGLVNVHLIFRRLHSQQLFVPLRIFRRLGSGCSPAEGDTDSWGTWCIVPVTRAGRGSWAGMKRRREPDDHLSGSTEPAPLYPRRWQLDHCVVRCVRMAA